MTLIFTKCDCRLMHTGKHTPGCPMNSNCLFCERPILMCEMMGKCVRIPKTAILFVEADKRRNEIMIQLSKKYINLIKKLNLLINHGAVSVILQGKIDALKEAFDAIVSRRPLTPSILDDAQSIVMKLQRIYVTQKAAFDKKVKEEEEAALAECDADDFKPGRAD